MILTCPSCSMRYLVADSAVPPEGRQVRCASCHHDWFQEGPAEDSFQEILEKEAENPVEPIPEAVKPIPEGSSVPARPEDVPPPEKIPADHSVLLGRLAGYAAAACVVAGVIGLIIALRGPLAKVWPSSLLLFDLAGVSVPLPGDGLVIDRIKAIAEETKTGQGSLIVRGSVINLKNTELSVPRVLATLWREDGSALESWIIDLPHATIAAEESFDFEAEYPGVPAEAVSVNMSFAAFIPKRKDAPAAPEQEKPAAEEAGVVDDHPADDYHTDEAHADEETKEEGASAEAGTDTPAHEDAPDAAPSAAPAPAHH